MLLDPSDPRIQRQLRRQNIRRDDGVDVLMKWELGSANDILPESEMSLKWMLPDDTYSLYGPDDHFVIRLFSCVGVLPSLRPFFF